MIRKEIDEPELLSLGWSFKRYPKDSVKTTAIPLSTDLSNAFEVPNCDGIFTRVYKAGEISMLGEELNIEDTSVWLKLIDLRIFDIIKIYPTASAS